MKYYSEFTKIYVQEICDALNSAGILMKDRTIKKPFTPDNFETLTTLLQGYVITSLDIYTFLNNKGLVNRGRCPYTGQRIDKNAPTWTYMNSRSIYLSSEGQRIMQKEDDEDFEKVMGVPSQPKQKTTNNPSGCYIATVCYGNEFAPEVITLKEYRDNFLSKNIFGRLFIKTYYFISPAIAKKLKNMKNLNSFVRRNILDVLVSKINRKQS